MAFVSENINSKEIKEKPLYKINPNKIYTKDIAIKEKKAKISLYTLYLYGIAFSLYIFY